MMIVMPPVPLKKSWKEVCGDSGGDAIKCVSYPNHLPIT